jgi:hypothetical protein
MLFDYLPTDDNRRWVELSRWPEMSIPTHRAILCFAARTTVGVYGRIILLVVQCWRETGRRVEVSLEAQQRAFSNNLNGITVDGKGKHHGIRAVGRLNSSSEQLVFGFDNDLTASVGLIAKSAITERANVRRLTL